MEFQENYLLILLRFAPACTNSYIRMWTIEQLFEIYLFYVNFLDRAIAKN